MMEVFSVPARFPLRFNHSPINSAPVRDPKSSFLPYVDSVTSSRSQTGKKSELELESRNRMFILGMGFVGQFFARNLQKEGWVVTGTCTSAMKKKQLEESGFDVCIFDANEPQLTTLNTLKCYTHLLVSIPPVAGINDLMLKQEELLKSALMGGNLQWLCYLSSTSVYGDCGGAWVDEDYPISHANDAARSRLVAEEGWLSLSCILGLSAQIFRLGGIYGPGRSAIDTILKQEPLSKGQKMRTSRQYTSRVHVEDVCQALKASICKPSSGRIYNIVDDEPASREEVFAYAENLIKKKWPGWDKQSTISERAVSAIRKNCSSGEKRVSNARMKKELGVRLVHPSYRSGLLSIINQIENPFQ